MWLQAIAIILPRVRDQYGVSNNVIGALSSSTFAGMFLGAFVWGTCMHIENRPVPLHAFILMAYSAGSDVLGRAMAFNLTLILTSIIGATTMLAQSYIQLCVVMFFLGTAVGVRFQPTQRISIYLTHSHSWQQGSMPTDQTLALETLPRPNRHLLTSLSVFFSFGSVVAAVAAILIIPSRSCSPPAATQSTLLNNLLDCDVQKDNNGWKVLLFVLAIIVRPLYIALTNTRFHSLPALSVLNIYDLLRHWSCSSAVSSSSDCTNPRGGLYTQAGKKTLWRRSHKSPNITSKN